MQIHIDRKHPGVAIEASFESKFAVTKDEQIRLRVEPGELSAGAGAVKRKRTNSAAGVPKTTKKTKKSA